MISAVNISHSFGGRELFKEISFRIGPHDRIGLVGSNGAGKSTLLKMLVGEFVSERGEIAKARFVTVGYLPQDGLHARGRTLYTEVESVFQDVVETRNRLEQVQEQMTRVDHDSEEGMELLEIFGELQHKLEASDAFTMESRIEKVLVGLGFDEKDMGRQTEEFSGGWQMRIALAKLLLAQPSLLLLDEPTNHLDLDSLRWLEDYLEGYEGAVMIVSHDRRFLDTMTKTTYDLSLGNLTEYAGNYTYYVGEKSVRREQQLAAQRNQQQQIKQTERFVERFRYKATKARQVQSRLKQLDKIELIEIEDEESGIRFHFPPAPPSGRTAMELRGIHKSYGSNVIFRGLDFEIDRGDRIAFVGVNGAGKSTLSRIIAGIEPLDSGERVVGHNVVLSYFAQHQAEELQPGKDVLQTVDEVATGDIRKRLRNLLGSFLFRGDDVFKKVEVLSGGEKSRLALAKMLLQPANLLILDEPTNHLDMRSKGVLQQALLDFEGSYVIVSHDRDFLDPLVTKVVEFRRDGVKTYPGNLSDFLETREKKNRVEKTVPVPAPREVKDKERKRTEAEERKQLYKKTKPLQEKVAKLETLIGQRERDKELLEKNMANPDFYKDGEGAREAAMQYKAIEKELNDLYFRWNEASRELERVKSESQG